MDEILLLSSLTVVVWVSQNTRGYILYRRRWRWQRRRRLTKGNWVCFNAPPNNNNERSVFKNLNENACTWRIFHNVNVIVWRTQWSFEFWAMQQEPVLIVTRGMSIGRWKTQPLNVSLVVHSPHQRNTPLWFQFVK